jgi:hypothetical protein
MLKNFLFIRHAQILKKIKDDVSGNGIGRGYAHYFGKDNCYNRKKRFQSQGGKD